MTLDILQKDTLPLGGFAGLKEHQLVKDPKAWGPQSDGGAWPGIGNFVYLADATFMPNGQTGLHPHHEIDVISLVVKGRIAHEGSLEDGKSLETLEVQVQRAGGEGFQHNEVNPDADWNRMLQLWVLPETPGQPAGYKVYQPQWGKGLQRIYGGSSAQEETFSSHTRIDVGLLKAGETVTVSTPFLAYLSQGAGLANGQNVTDGQLLRGPSLNFEATEDTQLSVVTVENKINA